MDRRGAFWKAAPCPLEKLLTLFTDLFRANCCAQLCYIMADRRERRSLQKLVWVKKRTANGRPYNRIDLVRDVSLKFSKTILRQWRSRDQSFCLFFNALRSWCELKNYIKFYCENGEAATKVFAKLFSKSGRGRDQSFFAKLFCVCTRCAPTI